MKTNLTIGLAFVIIFNSAMLGQTVYDAVKNNDLNNVKNIIENDLSAVNSSDQDRRTPLHWASRGVYYEIMKYLITKGADVNARDKNGITPLTSVVSRNNLEAAALLLDNGAKIQEADNLGKAPVLYAIRGESGPMLEFLIKKGADLEAANDYNRTPLLMACRETGELGIVKILVESGADINAHDIFGDTPLSLAAWRGFEKIVDYLLENHAEVSVEGEEGIKLLNYAADKRLWKLYRELTDKWNKDLVKILSSYPILHWAAAGGSDKIVEDLIVNKMPVNSIDHYGWTPIHYASYFGRTEVAKMLISNGADINARTPLGESPLYLAMAQTKSEIMSLLISAGAEQDIPLKTGLSGKYFGCEVSSDSLELFAPGIVSRLKGGHSNIVFSPNGDEAVWTEWHLADVGYAQGCDIWRTKLIDGNWSMPEVIVSKGDTPFYSVDGERLYFVAVRAVPPDNDSVKSIWYFEKQDTLFANPKYLAFDVNGNGLYWQFSMDRDNNLFFSGDEGVFRSMFVDGKYEVRENLSEVFHRDFKGMGPFISQDGGYIIFSSRELPGSYGGLDLYISYRNTEGKWSQPVNMGPEINSSELEILPIVSPDGKYLFVRANRNNVPGIYWTRADIIEKLKNKAQY